MTDNVITWSFANWITIGLMSLLFFIAFHFVTAQLGVRKG